MLYNAIPKLKSNKGWDTLKINKNHPLFHEVLVELEENDRIKVCPEYYLWGIEGAINKLYSRKTIYNMLINASLKLPSGYSLVILDAYRPYETQKSLYEKYREDIVINNPGKSSYVPMSRKWTVFLCDFLKIKPLSLLP